MNKFYNTPSECLQFFIKFEKNRSKIRGELFSFSPPGDEIKITNPLKIILKNSYLETQGQIVLLTLLCSSSHFGLCRVFHLNSTSFIPPVEQQKLDSCSMGGLSRISRQLWYRHLNFIFSKNLEQFSKKSDLKTKNGRGV